MLARLKGGTDKRTGRLFATDDFHDDVDRRVAEHIVDVGRQQTGRQVDCPGLRKVTDGRAPHDQRRPHLAGEVILPLDERLGHAAANDAQPD